MKFITKSAVLLSVALIASSVLHADQAKGPKDGAIAFKKMDQQAYFIYGVDLITDAMHAWKRTKR